MRGETCAAAFFIGACSGSSSGSIGIGLATSSVNPRSSASSAVIHVSPVIHALISEMGRPVAET